MQQLIPADIPKLSFSDYLVKPINYRIRLSKYLFFDKKGLFSFRAKKWDKFTQKVSDGNL